MYGATGHDEVVPIEPPLPEADTGAPMPCMVANEQEAVLAYRTAPSESKPIAVVRFSHPMAVYLGSPNDEALSGHPLFDSGLAHYTFAQVLTSTWIASLERRNRVHPNHRPEDFASLRHYVLPFHDSIFECIARDARATLVAANVPAAALADAALPDG